MRDYAQDSVARKQLELFAKYYGTRQPKLHVWTTSIAYVGTNIYRPQDKRVLNCTEQPLSWKLDEDQRLCITRTWEDEVKYRPSELQCVKTYASVKPSVSGTELQQVCQLASNGI
jgi:hypothetical protein